MLPGGVTEYLLSTEAAIFEFGILIAQTTVRFMVNGSKEVSYNRVNNETLDKVAAGLVAAAETEDVLVNHDCQEGDSACLVWVILESNSSVTFPGARNLGIGTSLIQYKGD